MLILRHAGEILLEKRPPGGIWGGLWSMPEADMDTDIAIHCRTRFGMETTAAGSLPELRHTFTHFRLRIAPQVLDVTHLLPRAEQTGQLWLAPRTALNAAIPTPVRKLLQQLLALETTA